ncbi:sirohydrochlorin chelatase [Mycobacterium parmense]|uniref:Cobalamin biosynthesis protein CbiX n=1 Tax=Mycobacterium parmense TaxID=185642 RepID=A0A7I7YWR5_9MYCO|nr:sirohydrochlorin chelatase [Mycobacterium parmense]MCV7353565.1 sirohydrochlorin chelatase [Mycobacterium parmense]ORW50976.1 cobalamin biosynthesis protein CbiX [Mycobacterium parmense]BBZ46250.1 cobalamin biosynthesis protein CbiX [Mycobacterium parmense]
MELILVAHGTRRPGGVATISDLAAQVGTLLGTTVRVAFVDVLGPTPGDLLSQSRATGRPAIVVPAFLSRGYHVRKDLPAHVAASGHPDVVVAPALGPGGQIARILADQVAKCGWQQGDSVVLASAGTSDDLARSDLHTTATLLSALTGSRVTLGFAGSGGLSEIVAGARRAGTGRVVVASYLLADGLFQEQLRCCGADLVSEPLGAHRGLARLVADRFRRAMPRRSDRLVA